MTVGGIINNPIANLLMRKSPWLSIYVGTALQVFSTLLGFSLPETLQTKKPSATLDTSDSEDYEQGNADGDHDQRISHQALLQAKVGTRRFFNFVHLAITQNRQVGLLLLSMLFTTFGRDAALMLTQYVHFRFGWGWGEAGLVVTIQQAVGFALYTTVIPLATKLLSSRGLGPRRKDLWLTRASGILKIIGGLTTALATTSAGFIGGICIFYNDSCNIIKARAYIKIID